MHNFVASLSDEVLIAVERHFQPSRSFEEGEFLFQTGDEADQLYQLLSGEINIGNYSYDGKELVLARLRTGDCFGEGGLIDGLPRANHAVAHTSGTVRAMKKSDFLALLGQYPEFNHQLLVKAYLRFRILMNLVSDANLLGLSNRLIRLIRHLYFSQACNADTDRRSIDISHEELGAMVVASRQSVSKELKALEKKGVIELQYGKIVVADISALSNFADSIVGYDAVAPAYEE